MWTVLPDFNWDFDDDDEAEQPGEAESEELEGTPFESLKYLKGMSDKGLITAEEYASKKHDILSRL